MEPPPSLTSLDSPASDTSGVVTLSSPIFVAVRDKRVSMLFLVAKRCIYVSSKNSDEEHKVDWNNCKN